MAASSRAFVSVFFSSVLAWSALAPVIGASATETPAVCHFEVHDTEDPGLWAVEPTQGTITSTRGTIICTGVIEGRQVSAEAGTLSWRLRYGGEGPLDAANCLYGRAAGSWEASLPMADGTTLRLTGPVEIVYAGVNFAVSGQLGTRAVQGIGETTSDPDRDPVVEPDVSCVTTPFRYSIEIGQVVVS
jgi:hypothetical protein